MPDLDDPSPWAPWRARFEQRAARPRPRPPTAPPAGWSPARVERLRRTLAKLQLGETGEGRVVQEVRRHPPRGSDPDHAACIALFVAEEGRHARLLGEALRGVGGQPAQRDWSASAFTTGRRLFGLRTKLVALLAAETVSSTLYGALADRLEPDPGVCPQQARLCRMIREIAGDEAVHLAFHVDFFRRHLGGPIDRARFAAVWLAASTVASAVVLVDHGGLLAELGTSRRELAVSELRAAAAVLAAVMVRPTAWDGLSPRRRPTARAA